MTQHDLASTPLNIEDFKFDGTQVARISADPDPSSPVERLAMDRGLDEHIAFLEHIVGQLQVTLEELRAQCEAHRLYSAMHPAAPCDRVGRRRL